MRKSQGNLNWQDSAYNISVLWTQRTLKTLPTNNNDLQFRGKCKIHANFPPGIGSLVRFWWFSLGYDHYLMHAAHLLAVCTKIPHNDFIFLRIFLFTVTISQNVYILYCWSAYIYFPLNSDGLHSWRTSKVSFKKTKPSATEEDILAVRRFQK